MGGVTILRPHYFTFILCISLICSLQALGEQEAQGTDDLSNALSIDITRNLDFGRIKPSASEAGTLTTQGQCSESLTCLGNPKTGLFVTTGEPHRWIHIALTETTVATSGHAGSLVISEMTRGATDENGISQALLNEEGVLDEDNSIHAKVNVASGQKPDIYIGAFRVNVAYE